MTLRVHDGRILDVTRDAWDIDLMFCAVSYVRLHKQYYEFYDFLKNSNQCHIMLGFMG